MEPLIYEENSLLTYVLKRKPKTETHFDDRGVNETGKLRAFQSFTSK